MKTTGLVNHFYFYCYDDDFGPFFLKFCSYFPYNAKLCINGNHWAKRQAAKAGIAFEALDNGFAAVDDPAALQAICDRLGEEQIDALLRKWLALLPHPFTAADRAAGYRYELSILQAEFSLTQMLDKPVAGRMFFEQVIRDNLDIGRPDQVALVFDRKLIRRGPRATPGPFRTRVITEGVTPSLYVDYKHTRIKQYHKQGRAYAPRPPSTTPATSDRETADQSARATRDRLLRQPTSAARPTTQPRPDHRHRRPARHHRPVTTATGARVPGLRLADRRSHALLSALLVFRCQPNGFANCDLRTLTGELRGLDPGAVTAGQITYDLRRLKHRGLITRIPAPTATRSPTTAWTPRNSSPPSTTAPAHRPGRTRRPRTRPGPTQSSRHRLPQAVDTLTATTQLAA